MTQSRPDSEQISAALAEVDAAVESSRACRARWRRRLAPKRVEALAAARDRCAAAVEPLRSWLGMAAWGGIELEDEVAMKKAVAAARYERQQIGKMLK